MTDTMTTKHHDFVGANDGEPESSAIVLLCPYCGNGDEAPDEHFDDNADDGPFDVRCSECEKVFEAEVITSRRYYSSKIAQ